MKRQPGFTLIEFMVVVALVAIVLTITIPGFRDLLERRRVEGVATELSADLQFARSEAVSRQTAVTVSVNAGGTGYSVAGGVTKVVTLPAGITIAVTPAGVRTYDGFRGTGGSDQSYAVNSAATSGSLQVNSTFMGRVQMCSPNSSLKGYPLCP